MVSMCKTAAAYIRVSTDKQEELSPDAQKRLIKEYASKNQILLSETNIFIENGISGKKATNRPEFQRMIAIAKSKEHPFDVILVWKFSRFARNQEESIVYKSMLKKDNIDVISISEPLIDGPFGSLIERIIEWMDEYYSIRLSGEVKRGMVENAMRGKNQAKPPFGYILENGILTIDQSTARYIELIFDSYANQSMSLYKIANMLNELGVRTKTGGLFYSRSIKYIISNPLYHGYVMWGIPENERHKRTKSLSSKTIIAKGTHKAIITDALFEKAQKRLLAEYTFKAKPSENQRHWLSGILRCSTCGRTLVSAGSKNSFQCGGYLKQLCKTSHFVKMKRMEDAVIKAICNSLSDIDLTFEVYNSNNKFDELSILNENLEKVIQKEARIKQAYHNGIDTLEEYKENKQIISVEKQQLIEKIQSIEKISKDISTNDMHKKIKNIYTILSSSESTKEEKHIAIQSIISKIIYDKETEHIDIYFYYS